MSDPVLQSWECLEELPEREFALLYKHPSSALAIFRKRLTDLAKSFVMAMLYMDRPLPLAHLDFWVKPGSIGERDNAISLLRRYRILTRGTTLISLSKEFVTSLRQALTGSGEKDAFGIATTNAEAGKVSVDDLDDFTRNQWEGILSYIIGNSAIPMEASAAQPSASVKELLKVGYLITTGEGGSAKITKKGFAFVLQDINTQVWALLFLYVNNAEVLGMSKIEVLSFLFLVSSLELGTAYSKKNLTPIQSRILANLHDFGIVYQKSLSSSHFFPTRLAVTLTSDSVSALNSISASLSSSLRSSPASTGSGTEKGFIIIETNFRVYAYTSSPLQISLLALFVNLRSRHPNLVTGKMTKRSVQRAVQKGITADQIISYLSSHAHPQMRRVAAATAASDSNTGRGARGILPGTIIDQIALWQLERDRMVSTSGYLFKDFDTAAAFRGPCQYAEQIGVLVWKDEKKRMFFVSRYEEIAEEMRRGKSNGDRGNEG